MLAGYPVLCTSPGCGGPARYKVAAEWSDGVKRELKTYALCCESCVRGGFVLAQGRHDSRVLAEGETLQPPAVYERAGGGLRRRADLETAAG